MVKKISFFFKSERNFFFEGIDASFSFLYYRIHARIRARISYNILQTKEEEIKKIRRRSRRETRKATYDKLILESPAPFYLALARILSNFYCPREGGRGFGCLCISMIKRTWGTCGEKMKGEEPWYGAVFKDRGEPGKPSLYPIWRSNFLTVSESL